MKKLAAIVSWLLEFAIIIGLSWKYLELFLKGGGQSVSVQFVFLPIFLLVPFFHWELKGRQYLSLRFRLNLSLLSILLSLCLVLTLSYDLKIVRLVGGASKEMVAKSRRQGISNECFAQWFDDQVEKTKSDRMIYALLLASSCLLLAARCSELQKIKKMQGVPKLH